MSESQISLSASNGNLVPKKGSYFNVLQQRWILCKMCNKYVLSGSGNNKPWGKNIKNVEHNQPKKACKQMLAAIDVQQN